MKKNDIDKLVYYSICCSEYAYEDDLLAKWNLHKKYVKNKQLIKKCDANCFLCSISNPIYIHNKDTDAECYLYVLKNKYFVVAFTGTDSINDICYDLTSNTTDILQDYLYDERWQCKVRKENNNNTANQRLYIQSGFFLQYISLLPQIRFHLNLLMKNNKNVNTILTTGHSLGGALATIFGTLESCYYKEMHGINQIILMTFGSPKCMSYDMVEIANHRIDIICRYVNGHDPVCNMPLSLYYTHLGDEKRIGYYNHFCGYLIFDIFYMQDHPITKYKKYFEDLM